SATSIPTSGEPLTTGDRTPGPRGKHQGTQTIRPPVTDGDPHPRENGGDPTPDPGILGSDKWALSGVRTFLGAHAGAGARPPVLTLRAPTRPWARPVSEISPHPRPHTGTPAHRPTDAAVQRCAGAAGYGPTSTPARSTCVDAAQESDRGLT